MEYLDKIREINSIDDFDNFGNIDEYVKYLRLFSFSIHDENSLSPSFIFNSIIYHFNSYFNFWNKYKSDDYVNKFLEAGVYSGALKIFKTAIKFGLDIPYGRLNCSKKEFQFFCFKQASLSINDTTFCDLYFDIHNEYTDDALFCWEKNGEHFIMSGRKGFSISDVTGTVLFDGFKDFQTAQMFSLEQQGHSKKNEFSEAKEVYFLHRKFLNDEDIDWLNEYWNLKNKKFKSNYAKNMKNDLVLFASKGVIFQYLAEKRDTNLKLQEYVDKSLQKSSFEPSFANITDMIIKDANEYANNFCFKSQQSKMIMTLKFALK